MWLRNVGVSKVKSILQYVQRVGQLTFSLVWGRALGKSTPLQIISTINRLFQITKQFEFHCGDKIKEICILSLCFESVRFLFSLQQTETLTQRGCNCHTSELIFTCHSISIDVCSYPVHAVQNEVCLEMLWTFNVLFISF